MVRLKIFLLFSLFLFTWAPNALAQKSIKLGIRGGVNFASGSITNVPAGYDVSSRTVFGLGGVVEFGLSDQIYLQAEPRYIMKGGNVKIGSTSSSIAKFTYAELPFSVKVQFGSNILKPYIFAGPAVSFLLKAESDFEYQGRTNTFNIKDETKSTEFSVDIGAGAAYDIAASTSLTADVRYTFGLTQIARPKVPEDKSTWNSRDVKIFLGILFGL